MKSWKTTSAGLLALAGTALAQFFPEYAKLGGFLAAVGSGAGLLFARDNNVTSEQAGAKNPTPPTLGGSIPLLFLLGALCIVPTGCTSTSTKPTPQVVAYYTLADTKAIVDKAERAYGLAVANGKVTVEKQAEVDAKITKFHVAFKSAVRAARLNYMALTPTDVQTLADALTATINAFAK